MKLIEELRAEANASAELHPDDSCIEVMRRAADWIDKHEPALDENHFETLQNLLDAINRLPGVFERVEAYMVGRGVESPKDEIEALYKVAYASEPVKQ